MPEPKKHKKTLREQVSEPVARPNLDAVLDHFFQIAHGPRAVAKMMFDEFQAAPKGSLMRTRIMEAILRGLKTADAKNPTLDDTGTISDADLERFLADRERRMAQQDVTNGQSQAGRPAGPDPSPQPTTPGAAGTGDPAPAAGSANPTASPTSA